MIVEKVFHGDGDLTTAAPQRQPRGQPRVDANKGALRIAQPARTKSALLVDGNARVPVTCKAMRHERMHGLRGAEVE